MSAEFNYDVFLSHNSKDKPKVHRLAKRLKDAGVKVWLDDWGIQAGDLISMKVDEGLEQSRVLLLCISPEALASGWVALERSTAVHRDPANSGRRFIPVLLSDCVLPATIRRYKYLDYREESERAFNDILKTCRLLDSNYQCSEEVEHKSLLTEARPSKSIQALVQCSNTILNILMRWGFFQRSAVVLLKTDCQAEVIHSSFVRTNDVGRTAAIRAKKTIPSRVWVRLNWLSFSSSGAEPSEIIQALTQSGAVSFNEHTYLKDGNARLGLVVDGLPDLSPGTIAQLQMWLNTVRTCFPTWEPLVVLKHAMPEAAATKAVRALSGTVECLGTVTDFNSDPTKIVPDRPVGPLPSDGIGALLSLAWRSSRPGDLERTAATRLLPWLEEAPEMIPVPLHAGGVVGQLEAMDPEAAKDLAKALCAWLIGYQPRLAAPIFRALGGASAKTLAVVAASAATDQPLLLDAWIEGVSKGRRSEVMDELGAQFPRAGGVAAAAWLRGVLRGQLADEAACRQWIRSGCPSLAPVAEAVLPGNNPKALLALLRSNAPAGHFHWLAQIAPWLDIPLKEVDTGTRQRPEFWALVQSLPVDSRYLESVLSLPANELLILGCDCTGADGPPPRPANKAHAALLRQESLLSLP